MRTTIEITSAPIYCGTLAEHHFTFGERGGLPVVQLVIVCGGVDAGEATQAALETIAYLRRALDDIEAQLETTRP